MERRTLGTRVSLTDLSSPKASAGPDTQVSRGSQKEGEGEGRLSDHPAPDSDKEKFILLR